MIMKHGLEEKTEILMLNVSSSRVSDWAFCLSTTPTTSSQCQWHTCPNQHVTNVKPHTHRASGSTNTHRFSGTLKAMLGVKEHWPKRLKKPSIHNRLWLGNGRDRISDCLHLWASPKEKGGT